MSGHVNGNDKTLIQQDVYIDVSESTKNRQSIWITITTSVTQCASSHPNAQAGSQVHCLHWSGSNGSIEVLTQQTVNVVFSAATLHEHAGRSGRGRGRQLLIEIVLPLLKCSVLDASFLGSFLFCFLSPLHGESPL